METKCGTDNKGNLRLLETNVKGRLVQSKELGKITLRLYLTKEQKEDYVLEKGKQPDSIMDIIIM